MGIEISKIADAKLNSIAKQADANQDGKLSGDEYQIFAKAATQAGVDYKTIGDTLEMNAFERWWFDVDKASTDGKDDGKISFLEGTESLFKGLIGGIPKAMAKNPIMTAATIAATGVATAWMGPAILVPLTAIGIASGVGMAGYGVYKAITSETDGETKQALETLGMGITTAALSTASAGKVLDKAAEAGVQSAKIAKDANIFTKVKTIFKATPEALKSFKGKYKVTTVNGTTKTYKRGKLMEERLADGSVKTYKRGELMEERLADGTKRLFFKDGKKYYEETPYLEIMPDGSVKRYFYDGDYIQYYKDGTKKCSFREGIGKWEDNINNLEIRETDLRNALDLPTPKVFFEDITAAARNAIDKDPVRYMFGHKYKGYTYSELGYQRYEYYVKWERVD